MTKFEYSDFYKFIASAGIALITLAALIPWLFLREPFDLFQTVDKISQLTPLAQQIILARQTTIQWILDIIPLFSAISFIFGCLGLIMGGVMWYRKTQLPIDKLAELNIKALEKQLTTPSNEEIKVQREEEIKAELEADAPAYTEQGLSANLEEMLKPDNVNSMVERAINIEKKVARLLNSCFGDTYTILPERRLGPIPFDVVMASKKLKPDYIFEVKYMRKGFHYSWLRDNVQKITYAAHSYEQETNRVAIPVLFIIGHEKMTLSTVEVEKYIYRVQGEIFSMKSQALIIFFTEFEFDNLECSKLRSRLNV